MKELEGKYDTVYSCHHDIQLSKDIMSNVVEVCDTVMAKKADNLPYYFMGQEACLAMEADETFQRKDGKQGNIIYNKNRIFK